MPYERLTIATKEAKLLEELKQVIDSLSCKFSKAFLYKMVIEASLKELEKLKELKN